MDGVQRRGGPRMDATHLLLLLPSGVLLFAILLLISCQQVGLPSFLNVVTGGGSETCNGQGDVEMIQHPGSWLTFGDDTYAAQDPSNSPQSNAMSPATVGKLRKVWSAILPDLADERPILVSNLCWPDGQLRDVLYLTTN